MKTEKKTDEAPRTRATVRVDSDNTDAEVLALQEKGAKIVFEYEEDFLELAKETVDALDHENQRQYFIALGAHRAYVKQKSKSGPTAGLAIPDDPLKSRAGSKLRVLRKKANGKTEDVSRGWRDAKGTVWHPCWKRPDEVGEVEEMGYVRVTQESDPEIITRGASAAGTSRVIAKKDGGDDLVLFKIEDRIYQQHLHAAAAQSTVNEGANAKRLGEQLREMSRQLKVEDTSSEIVAMIDRAGEHILEQTG